MRTIQDIVRIIRLPRLLLMAVVLWAMENWIATPLMEGVMVTDGLPIGIQILLIGSIICIAGGAYVVNDYFDIKIDRINRPDQVIVGETIDKDTAMHLFYGLTGVGVLMGIGVCVWAKSITAATIYVIVPGLMWFYSASYKRQLMVGNIVVSFAAALVPILLSIVHVDHLHVIFGHVFDYSQVTALLYTWFVGYGLFAFLLCMALTLTKNIINLEGEREMECHSLPIVKSVLFTRIIITLVIVLLIGYAVLVWMNIAPLDRSWQSLSTRYLLFAIIVPLVCYLWLLWAAKQTDEYRRVAELLRFVLCMGVLFGMLMIRA